MRNNQKSPLRWLALSLVSMMLMLLTAGCILAMRELSVHWLDNTQRWRYFAAGCLGSMLSLFTLYYIGRFRWLSGVTQQFLFFHRFNHEMAHAIAALLTGSGVASLNVSSYGGAVQTGRSTHGTFIVAMAPYIVSLPLLALCAFVLISPATGTFYCALLGAAWLYQLLSTAVSMSPSQSDFNQIAYPVCLLWIICAFILSSALVAALVAGDQAQAVALAKQTLVQSAQLVQAGFNALLHQLKR